MSEKAVGYSLLSVGLFMMIGAFIYILLVFTGKIEPIGIFDIPSPTLDMNAFVPTSSLPFGQTIQLPKNDIQLLPTDAFNKILNMIVTFFLMGFVTTFGYKLASLGIMLIRPVVMQGREEKQPQVLPTSPQGPFV